ncbi:hypothetical protein [Candidatus Nardonella dryophthoridicola]|uniref:Uncharacterized protein n=1 Tax=endosymbiont of Metamasius hemipterus TaxID=204627 RepID=A0ABT0TWE7_9GAMM|nr:hypothetical protein [Candidatus Nardonella dryophthoridicola]MCM0158321.1 hypothetical protein [endosymbiont of Metamasius hemipterus]
MKKYIVILLFIINLININLFSNKIINKYFKYINNDVNNLPNILENVLPTVVNIKIKGLYKINSLKYKKNI